MGLKDIVRLQISGIVVMKVFKQRKRNEGRIDNVLKDFLILARDMNVQIQETDRKNPFSSHIMVQHLSTKGRILKR